MNKTLLYACVFAVLLGGTAQAALFTDCMDALQATIQGKDAALTGDLSKDDAKLKKEYAKILKVFAGKDSTSVAGDSKLIGKIEKSVVKMMSKYGADSEIQADLDAGIACYRDLLQADLTFNAEAVGLMDDGYKGKAKLQDSVDSAQALLDGISAKAAKGPPLAGKALGSVAKAIAKIRKGVVKGGDSGAIGGHAKRFYVDRMGFAQGDCLDCHGARGTEVLGSAHYKWEGVTTNVVGHETHTHGKNDLINNFCIAIASNEGRCTQCHAGIGYADDTFDFSDAEKIDCLVCHDNTGTYQKAKPSAGAPEASVNLNMVAASVGTPGLANCGDCHFSAGGGDNVKHGDLSSDLLTAEKTDDVHMGSVASGGQGFVCQECHVTENHGIGGMPLHSVNEGAMKSCATAECHTGGSAPHSSSNLNTHATKIACQTCHIPTFARSMPTKVEWYWEDAGLQENPNASETDQYGKPTWDKMKGSFVWKQGAAPVVKWFSGNWNRMFVGENDTYTTTPVVLAEPVGSKGDGVSKLYPFKMMIGNQPADTVNNRMVVPHLFGTLGGANPFWGMYNWADAVQDGADYTGFDTYSGTFGFVDTIMYLTVNHEVAPSTEALGCADCHGAPGLPWVELGYSGNPGPDLSAK